MFSQQSSSYNKMSERRYGYFRCTECNSRWESAQVYLLANSRTECYKQDCKKCGTPCKPYRIEKIRCSRCGQTECVCSEEDRKKRHVDPKKPHRSELCHKCKNGRPCAE